MIGCTLKLTYMIWIGRVITVPLGIFLLAFLLVAVVLLQVNDSFLNPKFYRDTLRDADIYNFALNDLARSALDEARLIAPEDIDSSLDENPLVTSGLTTDDLVNALNRALPPDWIQGVVEQVLDEPGDYFIGERDDFSVTIQAGERVVSVVEEFKALTRKADAYNLLFEQVVNPTIEDAMETELPFGFDVSAERVAESVRRVVPPEWIQFNVESALNAFTSYIVGDADTFEFRLELSDRVDIAIEEVKSILLESDAYDILYDEVVEPIISDNLGATVQLPFDISISRSEITDAMRTVAPVEWVNAQAELIVDAAGRYVTQESDTLNIKIDLRDNKADARTTLVQIARQKFEAVVEGLPPCSTDQIRSLLTNGLTAFPECMPGGDTIVGDQLRRAIFETVDDLEEQVEKAVDTAVLAQIPDTITYTEQDLKKDLVSSGASENSDLLDDIRRIIKDGWSYTDADLRADLLEFDSQDSVDLLDDIRSFLADGWVYTEQDLREEMSNADPDAVSYMDDGRKWLKRARTWRFLVYLPVVILMVIIAFLGGRNWAGRVAWAAGYLAISAAAIWVLFGPVYSVFSGDGIDRLRREAIDEISLTDDFVNTQTMLINKAIDTGVFIVDGFASGIASKAIIVLIIGLVILAAAVMWPRLIAPARQSGIVES